MTGKAPPRPLPAGRKALREPGAEPGGAQGQAPDLERRIEELTSELRDAHGELLKTNSELMQLTLELEDRVAERTSELEAANASLRAEAVQREQAEAALREMNDTLERRVAERTTEVQRLADQLRGLASELTRIEQRERQRLADILHDHIQQLLVAARLHVERLTRESDVERRAASARVLDSILTEALDASRSLTVELCPPVLHRAGLAGGLNWLAARMMEKNQFVVRVRAESDAEPLSDERRFLLFECARELLQNVVKHASVSEASVTVARGPEQRIRLTVRDEGTGFDPDLLGKRRGDDACYGLFSIQQRLAHIGGNMAIATGPGRGTTITLTVPADERQ